MAGQFCDSLFTDKEKSACVIAYDLFTISDPNGEGGEVVYAIFDANKFVKFVNSVPEVPSETESVDYEGTNGIVPSRSR